MLFRSGNGNSADGRDHWPYCFSAIVAGAGVRRGHVHGKSDATASAPLEDPVHPTQLYEAAVLVVIAWLLMRWRRQRVSDAVVLGRYLLMAGSVRFAIEFIRVNVRVLGPLTVAHLVSLGLVIVGAIVLATGERRAKA